MQEISFIMASLHFLLVSLFGRKCASLKVIGSPSGMWIHHMSSSNMMFAVSICCVWFRLYDVLSQLSADVTFFLLIPISSNVISSSLVFF